MFLSFELFGILKSGFDTEKSFVQSHFVSPVVLACIRALIAIYCFTTIIVCYSWQASHPTVYSLKDVNIDSYTIINGSAAIGQSFSFFTYITFWSLGFYFLFASVHTFMYAFKQRTWLHQWPRWLQLAHSLYYTTVTCFPFLVTIVFWGTMYSGPWPEQSFVQWINISVHGLNSFFALLEIIFSAVAPPAIAHLSVVLLILSIYLGLAYLTKYTQGFYVYEWMNPAHGNASIILHILGYAGGMIALFFVAWGLVKLREIIAQKLVQRRLRAAVEKKLGNSNSSSSVDVSNVV